MLVKYDDGTEELLQKNVFFLPPGHTAIVNKDIRHIDFNLSKEFDEVISHVGKKIAEQASE